MRKVNMQSRSTLGLSSAQEMAARTTMRVLAGISVPPTECSKWRRRRDRHAEPSPYARTLADQFAFAAMGVPKENAQLAVDQHQRAHDAAYASTHTSITELIRREMVLGFRDDAATMATMLSDGATPQDYEDAADAADLQAAILRDKSRAFRRIAAEKRGS